MNKDNDFEIEETFKPIKKGISPIIILLIILLLLSGGVAYYYFVLESPQNIFKNFIKDSLTETTNNKLQDIESLSTSFSLDLNINIPNEDPDIKKYIDIINNIDIKGNISYDEENTMFNINPFYKEKELMKGTILTKDSTNKAYINLHDIYDKVIEVDTSSEDEASNNYNDNDYQELISSFTKAITKSINRAHYSKKIIKLNNEYLKKVTIYFDEYFISILVNDLIENEKFVEIYSKINNLSKEDTIGALRSLLDESKNSTYELSLYLGILNNKFIKLESGNDADFITITPKDNQYHIEVTNNYTLTSLIDISLTNTGKEYQINTMIEYIKEKITLDIKINLFIDKTGITPFSLDNITTIDNINEEEQQKILEKLLSKESIIDLLNDLSLSEIPSI